MDMDAERTATIVVSIVCLIIIGLAAEDRLSDWKETNMQKKNGTLTVEKAVVEGAKVTTEKDVLLKELLESLDLETGEQEGRFRIMDAELTNEIVGTLRGHFAENLIYNIPRRTSSGKKEWRECDLMKNGCPYKGKQPHIHILGVGYQGMLTAIRAYGRMELEVPEPPEMVEHGGKLYWSAYGVARDRHTGNEIGRWYLEAVMRKAGNTFIENEFGASICQSKALRNVGLALIPARLMESWIEDYKAGKLAFSVSRAKEQGYGPEPEKAKERKPRKQKEKAESTATTPGQRDLEAVTKDLAEKMGVDAKELDSFSAGYFETPGKAMLSFNRALTNVAAMTTITEGFSEWKSKQEPAEEGEQQEIEM